MKLNELTDRPGAVRKRKRVGRGIGSGSGKTSGRGHKGQRARAGVATRNFEGGQMPIYRRLPKRGFKNPFRPDYALVNLDRLQVAIEAGKLDVAAPIDGAALLAAGVVRRLKDGVRLLGRGEIDRPLTLEVAGASKGAVAAIEKAGGRVVVSGRSALAAPIPEAGPAEA